MNERSKTLSFLKKISVEKKKRKRNTTSETTHDEDGFLPQTASLTKTRKTNIHVTQEEYIVLRDFVERFMGREIRNGSLCLGKHYRVDVVSRDTKSSAQGVVFALKMLVNFMRYYKE